MSRFTTIKAAYRIVTPMFCGGADQEAELRLSSLKGALRFWWRTLQWGKVANEERLWEKESRLFGSSDQRFEQSKVRMQFDGQPQLEPKKIVREIFEGGTLLGAHYLGYGVMEAFASTTKGTKAGQLTREMIPGGVFTLALRCGPSLNRDDLAEIQDALVLLGTVGGLGSKSRKGYGSLSLTRLERDGSGLELTGNPQDELKRIATRSSGLPDWSAWSSQSRVVVVTGSNSPSRLLDSVGRELVNFRSWGNKPDGGQEHLVFNNKAEQNFPEDHHLSKRQSVAIEHPKRVVFGLPHNYGKGDARAVKPESKGLDRRASPLFVHIHQDDPRIQPVAVLTFLPSLFLPKGEKLLSFGNPVELERAETFWEPIHGFLDRLLDKPGATAKKDSNLKAVEVNFGKHQSS